MGNLSLWDTFRTQNQLLELLAPDVARDVALSVLADAPRRRLAAAVGAGRRGDEHHDRRPGDAVPGRELVHGAARRPRGRRPTAALRANALGAPAGAARRYHGPRRQPLVRAARLHRERPGLRRQAAATTTARTRPRRRSSTPPRTRALALMAAGARPPRRRARCSPARGRATARCGTGGIRLFRPRRQRRPLARPRTTRATGAGQFHEGGAYQYQWLVPQDPAGLVGLLGRRGRAADGGSTPSSPTTSCCATRRGTAARALGRAPLRVLRRRHLQPEQRARPARAVPVRLDRPAVEDRDRGARRRRRCSRTGRRA